MLYAKSSSWVELIGEVTLPSSVETYFTIVLDSNDRADRTEQHCHAMETPETICNSLTALVCEITLPSGNDVGHYKLFSLGSSTSYISSFWDKVIFVVCFMFM